MNNQYRQLVVVLCVLTLSLFAGAAGAQNTSSCTPTSGCLCPGQAIMNALPVCADSAAVQHVVVETSPGQYVGRCNFIFGAVNNTSSPSIFSWQGNTSTSNYNDASPSSCACTKAKDLVDVPCDPVAGGGGCGICPYSQVCVAGFCVCFTRFQCPDEQSYVCQGGECVPASPVVACVGDGCQQGDWWRNAMSDAANGVCVHWDGLDDPCRLTAWPLYDGPGSTAPRVGFPIRLTYAQVVDLEVNGALLPVDVEHMFRGNLSPQPPWEDPDNANGFSALYEMCDVPEGGDVDFSVCEDADNGTVWFWVDDVKRDAHIEWGEIRPAADAGLLGFTPPINTVGQTGDKGSAFRYKAKTDCAAGIECGKWVFDYFPVLDDVGPIIIEDAVSQ